MDGMRSAAARRAWRTMRSRYITRVVRIRGREIEVRYKPGRIVLGNWSAQRSPDSRFTSIWELTHDLTGEQAIASSMKEVVRIIAKNGLEGEEISE